MIALELIVICYLHDKPYNVALVQIARWFRCNTSHGGEEGLIYGHSELLPPFGVALEP